MSSVTSICFPHSELFNNCHVELPNMATLAYLLGKMFNVKNDLKNIAWQVIKVQRMNPFYVFLLWQQHCLKLRQCPRTDCEFISTVFVDISSGGLKERRGGRILKLILFRCLFFLLGFFFRGFFVNKLEFFRGFFVNKLEFSIFSQAKKTTCSIRASLFFILFFLRVRSQTRRKATFI